MGLISKAADLYYTFRFLKVLVTPWTEMPAYKLGIIDANGKVLRKSATLKTEAEKDAYTPFHRLVFNIKKTLNAIPGGKSKIASYAAALYLIKEQTGMSDKGIQQMLERIDGLDIRVNVVENTWMLDTSGRLQPGTYLLKQDAPLIQTSEFRAYRGSKVDIKEALSPVAKILGVPIYQATHRETGQIICFSKEDITR